MRRKVGDQRRSVVHIHADTLLCTKSGPMGPSGPQPNDPAVPWAENGGRFFDDVEKAALETGPEVQENSDPGPDGPLGPQVEHEGE